MTPSPRPPSSDPWVAVAEVLRPHGLRGIMRLKPLTSDPEEFLEAVEKHRIQRFFVRRRDRVEGELRLIEASLERGVVYATFEGIDDRTAAETYTNCHLVIPEEERWELPERTFYIDDLEGLRVLDAATGEELGSVLTAREGAAHDFLVLSLHAATQKETLLPYLPQFVPTVDLERRVVLVQIPEGLVE